MQILRKRESVQTAALAVNGPPWGGVKRPEDKPRVEARRVNGQWFSSSVHVSMASQSSRGTAERQAVCGSFVLGKHKGVISDNEARWEK